MSPFDFDNFPTKKGPVDTTLGRKALWNINDTNGFHTRIVPMPDGSTMRVKTRGGFPEFITEPKPTVIAQALGKWISAGIWFDAEPGSGTYPKLTIIRRGVDYAQPGQAIYESTANEYGFGVYESVPCGGGWMAAISFPASGTLIHFSKTYGASDNFTFDASVATGEVFVEPMGYRSASSSWMAITTAVGNFGSGFLEPAACLHYLDTATNFDWVHMPKVSGYNHLPAPGVLIKPGVLIFFQAILKTGSSAPTMFFSKTSDFGYSWTTVSIASLMADFVPPTSTAYDDAADTLAVNIMFAVGPSQSVGVYKILSALIFTPVDEASGSLRIWQSLDSGNTWTRIMPTGLPLAELNIDQLLHVGLDSYVLKTCDHVFYSVDGGSSWSDVSSVAGVGTIGSLGKFTLIQAKTAETAPIVIWMGRDGSNTNIYRSTDAFFSRAFIATLTNNYYAAIPDDITPLYRFGRLVYIPSTGEPMDLAQPGRLP